MTHPPLDDIRDWIAADDGWTHGPCPKGRGHDTDTEMCWHRPAEPGVATVLYHSHPYPPTLDGAADALPEGWEWEKYMNDWRAFDNQNEYSVLVPITGDEIDDRYRLAYRARLTMKGIA